METAAQLSKRLAKGTLDPVDLVDQVLAGIAAYPDQAIFIDVLAERARAEAKSARRRQKAGKRLSVLDGIPVAWKDLFNFEGRVTTAGSVLLKSDPPAAKDASLVAAAKQAGMIAVGTLNMTEFAYSGIGLNPHYGTPRNPRDPQVHRSPGGSSSGSGAVIAAGLVPIAIGTDTGGSIRIPASFNGVVGYKTSGGHYSMAGVYPLSPTHDTLGPLANSVEDCVLFDAAACGLARPQAKRQDPKTIRLLIPETVVFEGCSGPVLANFEAAIARLTKAGVKVKRIAFPAFQAIMDLNAHRGSITAIEALAQHWDHVKGPDAARMDQRVVNRCLGAEKYTAVDLVVIQQERQKLIAASNALAGDALLAFPTTPHVSMPIAPLEADQLEFFRVNAKTLRNTMLGNFLDWCGLAIPSGADSQNLPTGFLLNAPFGRDTQLLSAGLTLEDIIRG